MAAKLKEIHPGEILNEEFLRPMGITDERIASDLDVPVSQVGEIIAGRNPITVDTAMRLGLYFDMDPRFWLNLQAEYDIRTAEAELLPKIRQRVRPHVAQSV
jgi:addiction module HigA family antidote